MSGALSTRQLFAYAGFALPLAMVALPIYMFVPQFYAQGGLSLAWVGAVLLAVRLLAAFVDPLLGSWIESGNNAYHRFILLALPLLLLGFLALFHPPQLAVAGKVGLASWFIFSLSILYLGFSLATIAHQSWGAALAPEAGQRARITGAREGCALLGVVLAASLSQPSQLLYLTLAFCFCLALAAAGLLLQKAMRLPPNPANQSTLGLADVAGPGVVTHGWRLPFQQARFRALFAVLLVNGIASAVPATLFLFFVSDYLRVPNYAPLFLLLFFGTATLSIVPWVRIAARWGEARAWMAGMLWSALIGVWAFGLPVGGVSGFAVICALSGLALGADLALPAALLTGVIAGAGHSKHHEAAYFGVWNWGVQMTLALSAGISLPLLSLCGFVPGQGVALTSLVSAYALFPCLLKLVAAGLLWRAYESRQALNGSNAGTSNVGTANADISKFNEESI
jgi:glycoside/pentoside/hexuronide:cation symporter, GPH family